ncbi:MAG TPA: citrate/2-methylcitrate synthase [Devosiaceae bacterium]|nr:citrate/2-methylcitrate synthase [Devosiaceae bacterium]
MAWLTAEDALELLGTKPQSLYASVSRGRIRARPDPEDPRRSLYRREDVERLAGRAAGRRKSETIAADAMRWGDPVLETAISTVTAGRLYYRGEDTARLADRATLEDVASLLWQVPAVTFAAPAEEAPHEAGPPLQRLFLMLARRAATDAQALSGSPAELGNHAQELMAAIATTVTGSAADLPLHRRLAAAWQRPEAAHLLRRSLVLLAEHELNASTFAARIAASTGAPLSAAVLAALSTLTGHRHGGASAEIARLAADAERQGAPHAVAEVISGGHTPPGFGHRLYPDGDIRARVLLSGLALPPPYAALLEAGRAATGEEPNVDFALAAIRAAFRLPADAPLLLFAVARSVGWLAHAIEQATSGALVRPRARYVGPDPRLTP